MPVFYFTIDIKPRIAAVDIQLHSYIHLGFPPPPRFALSSIPSHLSLYPSLTPPFLLLSLGGKSTYIYKDDNDDDLLKRKRQRRGE